MRDFNVVQFMLMLLMLICVFAAIAGMMMAIWGWGFFLLAGAILLFAVLVIEAN